MEGRVKTSLPHEQAPISLTYKYNNFINYQILSHMEFGMHSQKIQHFQVKVNLFIFYASV